MLCRTILALALCGAAHAHASPRSDPTAGRAVFTGATLPNATSIGLNPAALGLGTRGEVFVAVAATLDQIRIAKQDLDPATGALTPGPRARDIETSPAGMLGMVVRTGIYTLGLQAMSAPAEQFVSGYDALRYHSMGGWQRNYVVTIAGSIRVASKFYVGASIAHDNAFLRLRYARDTALAAGRGPGGVDSDCGGAPCGIENPLATELYDVDVRSPWVAATNLKVTIGFAAQIYRDIWLGVAYHTPPGFAISTTLDGAVDIARAPRDGGTALRGGSSVYVQYPGSVDAEVRARLARLFELHVGGRWEDLSRMQAYDVRTYASAFVPNGVPEWTLRPRGFHDSFALWTGLEQIDTGPQIVRFGARVGFETSSTDDDKLSALTVSPQSFTLDAGVQLKLGNQWRAQLSYGLQYFPAVEIADSAFDPRDQLACIDSGFDYATDACAAARNGYAIPTATGTYERLQHALRIALRYELP